MITKINGKNIEISKGMNSYLEKKLTYFDKFVSADTPVTVSVSKRNTLFKIEIYFVYEGKDVKSKIEDTDYYAAVDKLMDILKNTVSKYHKYNKDKNHDSLKAHYQKEQDLELKELIEDDESVD